MSDQNKMMLGALLEKVEAISKGADKAGVLPDGEGYDASSAPNLTMMWCASILRILIMRVVEYVKETRGNIAAVNTKAEDLKTAIKDLPELREQVGEMSKLLKEIVGAINEAQKAAGGETPGEETQAEAPSSPSDPGDAQAEAIAKERAAAAQLDELAARIARGEAVDAQTMRSASPGQPLGKITPVKRPASEKAPS